MNQIIDVAVHAQLEHLVEEDGNYQDEYKRTRVLTKITMNKSILDNFGVTAYISSDKSNETRIRLLLRGTIEHMNHMTMMHQFVTSIPALHEMFVPTTTGDVGLFALAHTHLIPFIGATADRLGIPSARFRSVVPSYMDHVKNMYVMYQRIPQSSLPPKPVTIIHLPRGTFPTILGA